MDRVVVAQRQFERAFGQWIVGHDFDESPGGTQGRGSMDARKPSGVDVSPDRGGYLREEDTRCDSEAIA